MDQPNNVQAAIEAGQQIATTKDRIVDLGGVPLALVPDGMTVEVLHEVLNLQDQRADAPRRLKGTAQLQELDSFVEHVNRFRDRDTTIFADGSKVQLVAVLNYHCARQQPAAPANLARWGDHRAVYTCPLSEQWKRWAGNNEKWMSQEAFGQFIEDNLGELANPDPASDLDKELPPPAKVLEVARSLVVNAKTEFQKTINPTTGEGVFTWKKDNEVQGTTKVPKSFLLGIPVFEAGALYRVEARLRYSVENGAAKFQYALYQPQQIVRDAFKEVRDKAKVATGCPVLVGTPEQ